LELEVQDIGSLERRIQELKKYLIDVARDRKFTDPIVLAVSQQLDQLIVRHLKEKQNVKKIHKQMAE
jgi:hypothetical protein